MNNKIKENYKYGFYDEYDEKKLFPKGHSRKIVEEISHLKNEPEWMLKIRLDAYENFLKLLLPNFGPKLSNINFDELIYYVRKSNLIAKNWEDVPEKIRNTLNRLGISNEEQKWLGGISAQYDSEMIYNNTIEELNKIGVIFCSTDEAVQKYPSIVKKYFGKLVKASDNKFAALNTAFWSGGSFIYLPKNVKLSRPLQSYFRINARGAGQFERTLIIVEENSDLNYVEGCTAPIYSIDSLHAAVVEVFVKKYAKCKYSTIQNWSDNVLNLVTKRSIVGEYGIMEWIDGNLGSKINMKYPSTILEGDYSKGSCISIAIAIGKKIFQDTGAKMIHIGKNTQSTILSKSISGGGGKVNYRGKINIRPSAKFSKSNVECDTMILDKLSKSDTIPSNIVSNNTSSIEHEAVVSKISERQIYYLNSRGLSETEAKELIILGFIEPFSKEIPLEYAVELNKLIKLELEGNIG